MNPVNEAAVPLQITLVAASFAYPIRAQPGQVRRGSSIPPPATWQLPPSAVAVPTRHWVFRQWLTPLTAVALDLAFAVFHGDAPV